MGNGREKKAFFNGDSLLCPAAGQGVLSVVRPGRVAAKQPASLSVSVCVCECPETSGSLAVGTQWHFFFKALHLKLT